MSMDIEQAAELDGRVVEREREVRADVVERELIAAGIARDKAREAIASQASWRVDFQRSGLGRPFRVLVAVTPPQPETQPPAPVETQAADAAQEPAATSPPAM